MKVFPETCREHYIRYLSSVVPYTRVNVLMSHSIDLCYLYETFYVVIIVWRCVNISFDCITMCRIAILSYTCMVICNTFVCVYYRVEVHQSIILPYMFITTWTPLKYGGEGMSSGKVSNSRSTITYQKLWSVPNYKSLWLILTTQDMMTNPESNRKIINIEENLISVTRMFR